MSGINYGQLRNARKKKLEEAKAENIKSGEKIVQEDEEEHNNSVIHNASTNGSVIHNSSFEQKGEDDEA